MIVLTAIIITTVMALIAVSLWRKTRSACFPVGFAALYFWSIHGVWGFVFDKTVGHELFRYHYLESELFYVFLDETYLASIALYGVFCIAVLIVPLLFLSVDRRHDVSDPKCIPEKIHIRHALVLIVSIIAAVLSFLLIANVFLQAVILGQTGYRALSENAIPFFTVHQLLLRVALFSALFGASVAMSGEKNQLFSGRVTTVISVSYFVTVAMLFIYLAILGNKNELFTGLLFAGLLYLETHEAPPYRRIGAIALVGLLLVGSVDYLRNYAVLSGGGDELELTDIAVESSKIVFSNEAFAAHMSMYGVLANNIEPTNGNGIRALVFSFVPRDIWPDRPVGNYYYYAEGVGASLDRGYTVHHATSWYLDFGATGVILGGLILGAVWTAFFNSFKRLVISAHPLFVSIAAVSIFGVTAYIPVIIRGGVEVYKGAFLGAVVIPVLILMIAADFRFRPSKAAHA